MAYNGFYTRQEQEDAQATQITNPNRVGSGFINLGPQQRFQQGPAANWQTQGLVGGGGAPQGVSDIWGSVPQPKPQQGGPPPGRPPPGMGGYGAGPPRPPFDVSDPTAAFNGMNLERSRSTGCRRGCSRRLRMVACDRRPRRNRIRSWRVLAACRRLLRSRRPILRRMAEGPRRISCRCSTTRRVVRPCRLQIRPLS